MRTSIPRPGRPNGRPGRAAFRPYVLLWVSVLSAVVVGFASRASTVERVFTPDGVRLLGNDPYYHVLRAHRGLATWPGMPARDERLSYPDGADIPWPPVFDAAVAGVTRAWVGASASLEQTATAGAWVPWLVGGATIAVTGLVGLFLTGSPVAAAVASFYVALSPGQVMFSRVGDVDQHGTEALALLIMVLGLVLASASPVSQRSRWVAATLVALGTALAFGVWHGSALHVGILWLAVTAAWIATPSDGRRSPAYVRTVGVGLLAGAALIAGFLAAWGPPGALARVTLEGLTGFHVLIAALGGASLLSLSAVASFGLLPGTYRLGPAIAAAAAVPLVGLLLVPGLGPAVHKGLTVAGPGTPWHRNIQEFDPLLFGGYRPIWEEAARLLELTGLALPFALAGLLTVWRARDELSEGERRRVAFQFVWTLVFVGLALRHQRFLVYLGAPLGVVAGQAVADQVRRHVAKGKNAIAFLTGALGVLILLGPTVPWHVRSWVQPGSADDDALRGALEWLRGRSPAVPGASAVLAEWSYGHLVQFVAGKPVVVSPFGTDVGEAPMRDFADAFLARDAAVLDRVLERRQVGWVVLTDPLTEAHYAPEYAAEPLRTVAVRRSWTEGLRVHVLPSFEELAASRLFFLDGQAPAGSVSPAIHDLRLVYESRQVERWRDDVMTAAVKVFERVPGAVLEVVGAEPGAPVAIEIQLWSRNGSRRPWRSGARADEGGRVRMRVPYATGRQGQVEASAYRIGSGSLEVTTEVGEEEVRSGGVRTVWLTGAPASAGPPEAATPIVPVSRGAPTSRPSESAMWERKPRYH